MEDNKKIFFDFLDSDKTTCEIKNDRCTYEIVKIPFGNNLNLLYCGYDYGDHFSINSKLSYGGIYDCESKELYCLDYTIRSNILNLSWDENPYKESSDIFNEINTQLQEIITDYVNENKKEFYDSVKKDYEPYASEKNVYRDFLENNKRIEYKSGYEAENYEILLNYMDKGKDYLYDLGLEYAMEHKERIGEQLIDIDAKNKFLNDLYNNTEHEIHKIKDIVDSLKDIDCVTVKVSINKNGKDCDFKYDRDCLLSNYDNSYLSLYNMASSDKGKYESLFGRWEDFHYEDITKIEFRNKILYEDKNFNNNLLNDNQLAEVQL